MYQEELARIREQYPELTLQEARKLTLGSFVQVQSTLSNAVLACLWDIWFSKDWVNEDDESANFYNYVQNLFPDEYVVLLQNQCEVVEKLLAHLYALQVKNGPVSVVTPDGSILAVTVEYLLSQPDYTKKLWLAKNAIYKLHNQKGANTEEPIAAENTAEVSWLFQHQDQKQEIVELLVTTPTAEAFESKLYEKGYKVRRGIQAPIHYTLASSVEDIKTLQPPDEGSKIMVLYIDKKQETLVFDLLQRYLLQ